MSDLTDATLFKALDGLRPVHGGRGRYPGVGRWTKHLDPDRLEPCVYGYHLTRGPQVLGWLGPTLYEAEPCPDHDLVDGFNNVVTCRVRLVRRLNWNDTVARLFAADCAETTLLAERASGREPDERSWAAVDAARRFASGEIGSADLSVAWYAAAAPWGATRAAARDAALSAAWAAAKAAAWDAALSAAWAARDAAAAARDAARATAGVRSAAGIAAGIAAEAAAWATAAAARDATGRDATGIAARATAAAARDAAQDAQYRRLCAYLEGSPIPPVEPLYGVKEGADA